MMLGIAAALPLYELVGPDKKFVAFAIYMGVAMSITAFPVLARILVERRMLKRPVGALTMACAAIDDVTAWFLIAFATAVAASRQRHRRARDDRGWRLLPHRHGVRREAPPRSRLVGLRRGREGARRLGRRDSPGSSSPPTPPRRSASR